MFWWVFPALVFDCFSEALQQPAVIQLYHGLTLLQGDHGRTLSFRFRNHKDISSGEKQCKTKTNHGKMWSMKRCWSLDWCLRLALSDFSQQKIELQRSRLQRTVLVTSGHLIVVSIFVFINNFSLGKIRYFDKRELNKQELFKIKNDFLVHTYELIHIYARACSCSQEIYYFYSQIFLHCNIYKSV